MTSRAVSLLVMLAAAAHAVSLDPLHDLTRAGVELFHATQYDKALLNFNKAQEHAPDSGLIYYNIGCVLYRQGAYEEAQKAFEQAVRNADDPRIVQQAHFNLGNTHYMAGAGAAGVPASTQELAHWEEAIRQYEKALDYDPDDHDAKYNIELVRRRLKQLLDMQRPSKESEERKKQADELVAQRQYHQALQIMQQVLEQDPGAQKAYADYTGRLQDVVNIIDGNAPAPAEESS